MKVYEYDVIAFRQHKDTPIQVCFVAPANEVIKWAGVPRKKDELLTGFQRFKDSKRIEKEIIPYLNNSQNSSPTSLIVALRTEHNLGRCRLLDTNVKAGELPVVTKLLIEIAEDVSDDELFNAALKYVRERLDVPGEDKLEEEIQEQEGDELEDEETTEGDEGMAEGDEETTEDDEEAIDLGAVTLRKMKELLEDPANRTNKNFRDAIYEFVKPAFLIDGQHRAFAASKLCLPFSVCGLYDASWEEQVFQFTVVNLKPKKISPALITSIASLSLTAKERKVVEARLRQAKVRMWEVTVMSKVNYDGQSPFAEKIDMAVGDPETRADRLGYGIMKRVAKEWFRCNRIAFVNIAKSLFCTNNMVEARHAWQSDDRGVWFHFFCAFWNEIRMAYSDTVWSKGSSRLFIGASLWALQEAILSVLDGNAPGYWKIEDESMLFEERLENLTTKMTEVVSMAVAWFPEELWKYPWEGEIDETSGGRKQLLTSIPSS